MNPRIRETLILSFSALLITIVIVILILAIFRISGNQDLLLKMLNSAVEGKLYGVPFTAVGPMAMWIIVTLILLLIRKRVTVKSIQLFLNFTQTNPRKPPPAQRTDFPKATCYYSIFSGGKKIESDKKVTILTDLNAGPYIHVQVPNIDNPEFQIKFKYLDQLWISDSYSSQKGNVNLQ